MFEKFGEFNSAEEINAVAKTKLIDGKKDELYAFAKENGIDADDVDEFVGGYTEELVTVLSAAVGKIEVESENLKIDGILKDWTGAILHQCMEDQKFCKAVRSKNKSLKGCMAVLIKFAFENKVQVSDEIVKSTKIIHNGKEEQMRGPLYLGVPNNAQTKKIVRDYYLG